MCLPLVLTEWPGGVAFEYHTQTDNKDFAWKSKREIPFGTISAYRRILLKSYNIIGVLRYELNAVDFVIVFKSWIIHYWRWALASLHRRGFDVVVVDVVYVVDVVDDDVVDVDVDVDVVDDDVVDVNDDAVDVVDVADVDVIDDVFVVDVVVDFEVVDVVMMLMLLLMLMMMLLLLMLMLMVLLMLLLLMMLFLICRSYLVFYSLG